MVESGASTFTMGTLDTVPRDGRPAPDLTGPHGLLPPLQVETLAFTRPYEAGLQWQVGSRRLEQDHLDPTGSGSTRPRIGSGSMPASAGACRWAISPSRLATRRTMCTREDSCSTPARCATASRVGRA